MDTGSRFALHNAAKTLAYWSESSKGHQDDKTELESIMCRGRLVRALELLNLERRLGGISLSTTI